MCLVETNQPYQVSGKNRTGFSVCLGLKGVYLSGIPLMRGVKLLSLSCVVCEAKKEKVRG